MLRMAGFHSFLWLKKYSVFCLHVYIYLQELLCGSVIKNLPAMQETPLGWEDPLEKGMEAPPVFLPGESHGQRSLVGYSPRGHRKLGTT